MSHTSFFSAARELRGDGAHLTPKLIPSIEPELVLKLGQTHRGLPACTSIRWEPDRFAWYESAGVLPTAAMYGTPSALAEKER